MGQRASVDSDEARRLEEAHMYSLNATKREIRHIRRIFIETSLLEKMKDEHFDPDVEQPPSQLEPSNSSDEKTMRCEDEHFDPDVEQPPSQLEPSNSSDEKTMRFEEFLCIPEFSFHPLARPLFDYARKLEPFFNDERLSFTKFSRLLSVMSDTGSMEEKTRLGFYLIAGEKGGITRDKLKCWITLLTPIDDGISEEMLDHAAESTFVEMNLSGSGSSITLAEYRRSCALADDYASKLLVRLKYYSLQQLLTKRTHRKVKAAERRERVEQEKKKQEEEEEKARNKEEEKEKASAAATTKELGTLLESHSNLRSEALLVKKK